MYKNVATKLTVFAFDSTTNLPKTGDAANITAYVDIDDGGVTVLADTSATEKDSTNAKGYYIFDLTAGETNGNKLLFSAKSATSNIVVIGVPAVVFTDPPNYTLLSVDANGRVDVIKVAGTTQTAGDLASRLPAALGANGNIKADVRDLLGTAWLTPATAGTPDVNAKQIGAVAQTGLDIAANYTAARATKIDNLDAAVTTRMATFSVPTNFSALSITAAGLVAVTSSIKKNQALSGFTFVMVDSSDHITGKTGLTITATVSIDGAAFASCTNSASEISAGAYKINLAAADLNGNSILLKFSGTGADTRFIEIVTQP